MSTYVMLILYSSMSANGWGSTRLHQEFESLKACERVHAEWKAALKTKYISGQCYYKAVAPLPGDCKAWSEFEKKWTNTCLTPGNDIRKQCQALENPPAPYDKCRS